MPTMICSYLIGKNLPRSFLTSGAGELEREPMRTGGNLFGFDSCGKSILHGIPIGESVIKPAVCHRFFAFTTPAPNQPHTGLVIMIGLLAASVAWQRFAAQINDRKLRFIFDV